MGNRHVAIIHRQASVTSDHIRVYFLHQLGMMEHFTLGTQLAKRYSAIDPVSPQSVATQVYSHSSWAEKALAPYRNSVYRFTSEARITTEH